MQLIQTLLQQFHKKQQQQFEFAFYDEQKRMQDLTFPVI